ncbi:outer membrane lipoprotein chaperone LolA [bacterium]|nr:outer membrane lipoprotein chaperone LolA [bacterium]
MKKLLILILLSASITLFASTVQENLAKIQEKYKDINGFEAKFEQNFYHKAYKKDKKSSGDVVFKKELFMKWSYTSPERKYIISNQEKLWVYEPENEQVFVSEVKQSELTQISRFLFQHEDLQKEYDINIDDKTGIIMELTPKSKDLSYKKITLSFNSELKLTKTEMVDQFDNMNTIIYSKIKLNPVKDSSFFEFKIPEGVEVIEQK